ncbi:hypothetical protein GY45DRAFT_794663 [Cubamyces sp. BRFM 1775]|nr:hypothetical protein GY45DRAFT_794663 [Cubamyces sp. BRFM 1775]
MNSNSQNMGRSTRANTSAPLIQYTPTPEDLMYFVSTFDDPDLPARLLREDALYHAPMHDTNSQGHNHVHSSDAEWHPTVAADPSNTGYVTSGVARTDISGHDTMQHTNQGPQLYVQPENFNAPLVPTRTSGSMGHNAGASLPMASGGMNRTVTVAGPSATANPLQEGGTRSSAASQANHVRGQRSSTRPKDVAPSNPPSTSLSGFQRYKVPLPADTDPNFRIRIIASGKVGYGLKAGHFLSCDRVLRQIGGIENTVAERVYGATVSLESIIQGGFYVQRVYFHREKNTEPDPIYMFPLSRANRVCDFTLGHLISVLQSMQSEDWYPKVVNNHFDNLRDVTGLTDEGKQWTVVHFSDLYATAIRRRRLLDGLWSYFLQLEVRIPS